MSKVGCLASSVTSLDQFRTVQQVEIASGYHREAVCLRTICPSLGATVDAKTADSEIWLTDYQDQ